MQTVYQPAQFSKVSQRSTLLPQNPISFRQPRSGFITVVAASGRSLAEAAVELGFPVCVFDCYGDQDTIWATSHAPQSASESRHNPSGHAVFARNADAAARDDTAFHRSWHQLLSIEAQKSGDSSSHYSAVFRRRAEWLTDSAAILLGGGCENRPQLLDAVRGHLEPAALERLPSAESIARLRSPSFVQQVAQEAGAEYPETVDRNGIPASVCSPESWLVKRSASAGGLGVRRFSLPLVGDEYAQQFVGGKSYSAVWVAARGNQTAFLVGVTESLGPADWPAPTEFIYRGSFGPVALEPSQVGILDSLGRLLSKRAGFQGLIQCDFILDDAGQIWVLEVNPRWTAGMEILRLAGLNPLSALLADWQAAHGLGGGESDCRAVPRSGLFQSDDEDRVYCKVTYYAPHALDTGRDWNALQHRVVEVGADRQVASNGSAEGEGPSPGSIRISMHDIPNPDYCGRIEPGHPVCTLIASMEKSTGRLGAAESRAVLLCCLEEARNELVAALASGRVG